MTSEKHSQNIFLTISKSWKKSVSESQGPRRRFEGTARGLGAPFGIIFKTSDKRLHQYGNPSRASADLSGPALMLHRGECGGVLFGRKKTPN